MVATIVPFGSEVYFATLLSLGKYNNFFLLVAASVGNVLGSVFNWVCGYYVNFFIKKSWFPIKEDKIEPDFISALKLCKRRRIGAVRPTGNRELFYKKDMGILARSGFSYDISKKILSMDSKEFQQLFKLI